MRWLTGLLLLAAVSGNGEPASMSTPGRACFVRRASPELDRFTNAPSRELKEWFRDHFTRMVVFTPYFDTRTSWYPNGLVYINLYAVPPDSELAAAHPDWILRGADGSRLYIPWGCSGGRCAQFAADITNPDFRNWWIDRARRVLSHHYRGMWIDDVNTQFRVSDGNGRDVTAITTQHGVLNAESWRLQVAQFVEQIRNALPGAEIVHNSVWFAGPEHKRDADPAIHRQIMAADHINIERGIGSDTGLTGGNGEWSIEALFAYIDRVHQAGKGVTIEELTRDRKNQEYALAGYFLISTGMDCIADNSDPEHWWKGYEVDLGTPLGPRSLSRGVFQRKYSHGIVILAEPGTRPTTVQLPGEFRDLDGAPQREIVISGREGIVLIN